MRGASQQPWNVLASKVIFVVLCVCLLLSGSPRGKLDSQTRGRLSKRMHLHEGRVEVALELSRVEGDIGNIVWLFVVAFRVTHREAGFSNS